MHRDKFLLAFVLIWAWHLSVQSQVMVFEDVNFEAYLVNERCVDTSQNGTADITVDFNKDGQIQVSEAGSIQNLNVTNFGSGAHIIRSTKDFHHFSRLKKLTLFHNDSLMEISNLGLDSLEYLLIGSHYSIQRIDLSDLPMIHSLRIEDIAGLEYLNIQNGRFADTLFSLFYTSDIEYACVDSIAAEYNEVAWHMGGLNPTIDFLCNASTAVETLGRVDSEMTIFPNPTSGRVYIGPDRVPQTVTIMNAIGELVYFSEEKMTELNLSHLENGIYYVRIRHKDKAFAETLIINH